MNILLAFLKTLNNFTDWFGSSITISVPASHFVIGQQIVLVSHLTGYNKNPRKCMNPLRLQVTMTFQDHRRVIKIALQQL
jgi:hypothetical protein